MKIELRDYQARSIDGTPEQPGVRDHFKAGVRRVLLHLPTGAGKGVIVAYIIDGASKKGSHILFVVRGKSLVHEFSLRLTEQFGVPHGVIMGNEKLNSHWPTQICSIDTLASWVKRGKALPPAEILIVDEADESIAPKWDAVLALYPKAYLLGQTATPIRADGKGLKRWFDVMVQPATTNDLIEQRYLNDFEGLRFVPDMNDEELQEARESGDAADRVLHDMSTERRGQRCGHFVESWHETTPGRPTVGFAINVEDSKGIVERFNAERVHGAPICVAVHIDGNTTLEERAEVRRRMELGEVQLVSSVGVMGRGVDWPVLQVAALWRPTKSLAWHLQACGRVLRTHDCACGALKYRSVGPNVLCTSCSTRTKPKAFFLDHVDNMRKHGHPAEPLIKGQPVEWSLDGAKRRKNSAKVDPIRECPKCRSPFISRNPRAPCPKIIEPPDKVCGYVRPAPPKQNTLPDGESAAVAAIDIRARKLVSPEERVRRGLYAIVAEHLEKGWPIDLAGQMWQARFKKPTPPSWEELLRIEQHVRARWAKRDDRKLQETLNRQKAG